jgi:hypothetical protein
MRSLFLAFNAHRFDPVPVHQIPADVQYVFTGQCPLLVVVFRQGTKRGYCSGSGCIWFNPAPVNQRPGEYIDYHVRFGIAEMQECPRGQKSWLVFAHGFKPLLPA